MNKGNHPAFPAFPAVLESGEVCEGLTKREEFAKAAMMVMLAEYPFKDCYMVGLAKDAVKMADALLAALEEKKN